MDLASLEAAAYRAWPAAEVEQRGGWRLRFTNGVTRRGNSVWTYGPGGPRDLTAQVAHAESFYSERGIRTMFQLGPLTAPPELDSFLEERGYAIDAPVSLQTAGAAGVASLAARSGSTLRVAEEPDEAWWSLAGAGGRFRDISHVYRALLGRMPGRVCYARAECDGATVATGLGVAEGPWLGVYSMLTAPAFRSRGIARTLLGALGRFAVDAGAERLYLQVERENPAARQLYARAGFEEVSGYHYRVAEPA